MKKTVKKKCRLKLQKKRTDQVETILQNGRVSKQIHKRRPKIYIYIYIYIYKYIYILLKWKMKKIKFKQTEMKYWWSAHASTQNCTVLHSKTDTPHKRILARSHQKSHRSWHQKSGKPWKKWKTTGLWAEISWEVRSWYLQEVHQLHK